MAGLWPARLAGGLARSEGWQETQGKGASAHMGKVDFILQSLSKGADLIRSVF